MAGPQPFNLPGTLRVKLRILLVLFCMGLCRAATAASAGTDELWEVTLNMDMGGMKLPGGMTMPGMTMKSCTPKGAYLDPKSMNRDNKDCTFYDTHVAGNKVTYKFKCTGEAPMEGSGEATRTGSTVKGSQRGNYQGHDMVQNYEGHIIGSCNAADEKASNEKRVADAKAAGATAMAGMPTQRDLDAYKKKACDDTVDDAVKFGGSRSNKGAFQDGQLCAGKLAAVCPGARSTATTYEGYVTYRRGSTYGKQEDSDDGWVVDACKIDLDKSQAIVCRKGVSDKNYKFLGENCPAQAKALRAENCADFAWGLSGDTPDKANYAICSALGSGPGADRTKLGGGAADPRPSGAPTADKSAPTADKSTAEKAADSIVEKAKSLKGLLGF